MHYSGAVPADILIIGDCPDSADAQRGSPYMSWSSQAFRRLFKEFKGRPLCLAYAHEQYMQKTSKLFTAVSRRPNVSPKPMHGKKVLEDCWKDKARLLSIITKVQPKIIILAGVYPLFLFTGEAKANDFRGSHWNIGGYDFVSTLNPYILEVKMAWIELVRQDFQRVMRYLDDGIHPPVEQSEIFPEFGRVLEVIDNHKIRALDEPLEITADIETTPGLRVIDCFGMSITDNHAICIPFTAAGKRERSYFGFDEEVEVWHRLRELFAMKNVSVCGQNWAYDATWLAYFTGFVARVSWDTMIAQHTMFAHLDKSLGFLGSLYSDYHQYWKDERKGGVFGKEAEKGQWLYNCKDINRTTEIAKKQRKLVSAMGMDDIVAFQTAMTEPVMYTMFEGHQVDHKLRKEMLAWAIQTQSDLNLEALTMLGKESLNVDSPKQMKELFYEELNLPTQYKGRGQKRTVSSDENSLKALSLIEPLIAPPVHRLADAKSLGKLAKGCLNSKFDEDGRFRCDFVIPGTVTYRFASRTDAFGMGTNAQNITKGKKRNLITIPNNRKIFTCEEDYIYFAIDLDRADAQVVAWEANDLPLKEAFRLGVDVHTNNAKDIFGSCSGDGDPNRAKAKAGVHAVNYVVRARTLGITLGITTKEAQHFIDMWFEKHPAIKEWHARVEDDLYTKGYIENAFGYRCYFPGRVEAILSEAVAWCPQSTVANVTNRAYMNIHKRLPRHAQVRMQVHDELTGVIAKKDLRYTLPILRDCFKVVVPYPEPLIIPVGLKVSEKNWGDVKDAEGEILEMWNQEII